MTWLRRLQDAFGSSLGELAGRDIVLRRVSEASRPAATAGRRRPCAFEAAAAEPAPAAHARPVQPR